MDGGGAQPRNDTDVTESSGGAAAPPAPTNDPDVADSSGTAAAPPASASASASSSSSAPSGAASKPQPSITLVHDGRFVQFNVSGNVFEITSKYTTPIRWLGKGAYGTVCKARNSEKDEMVAIKKIANAFSRISDGRRTLREIKILLRMKHENILEIRDIIPPAARETFNDVYIVYELMDYDLLQLIRSTQELSKQHKQYILYQILRGLKYIHSANVLHRDLTPANLLINSKNCHLKICDFGLARTSSETNFMTRDVVTIWYRAPELLLDSCQYTTAIDIWSVGCIYMEMINRAPLFQGNNQLKQLKLVLDFIGTPNEADLRFASEDARNLIRQRPPCARQSIAQKYPHVPREAVDLVEKMLTFDPEQRITAEKALEHPYLANLHVPNHGPDCTTPISFEFEKYVLSAGQLRKMIYEEALAFNPDYKI